MKMNKLFTGFCIVFFMMTMLIYTASAGALLRQGSRGSDVTKVQLRLKVLGYFSGSIDGVFGLGTKSAVIRFQKAAKLTQDGIIGPATMAKIFVVSVQTSSSSGTVVPVTIKRILQNGSRGADVALLQKKLTSIGFSCGIADGIFGNNTKNAVIKYQKSIGLSATGIVSVSLSTRLFSKTTTTIPPPSNSGTSVTIKRTLQNGSRGTDVAILQKKLTSIGFNCGIADGIFGNNTKNAVIKYQKSIGLSTTGIVSISLSTRLFSKATTPAPPPVIQNGNFKPVPGSLKSKVIFLDPGHGGSDPGAIGGSLREKNINLDMGLRLKRVLEQAGATVILTRATDTSSSLFYRSALVNHYILQKEIVKLQTALTPLNTEIALLKTNKIGLEAQLTNAKAQLAQKQLLLNQTTANLLKTNDILKERTDELSLVRNQNELPKVELAPKSNINSENILKLSNLIELWYTLESDPIDAVKRAKLEKAIGTEDLMPSTDIAIEITTIKSKLNLENFPLYASIVLPQGSKTLAPIAYDLVLQLFIMSVNEDTISMQAQITALGKDIIAKNDSITLLNATITPSVKEIYAHQVIINQKNVKLNDYIRKAAGFKTYLNNPNLSDRTGIFTSVNSKASKDVTETFDLMATDEYVENFLFISLHVNAVPASSNSASGVQVYYRGNDGSNFNTLPYYYTNYNAAARQNLSSSILSILTSTMGFSGKYMKPYVDNFSVLRENNLVSCLIELGFISNAGDRSILCDQIDREKAAGAIYQGIINYFN